MSFPDSAAYFAEWFLASASDVVVIVGALVATWATACAVAPDWAECFGERRWCCVDESPVRCRALAIYCNWCDWARLVGSLIDAYGTVAARWKRLMGMLIVVRMVQAIWKREKDLTKLIYELHNKTVRNIKRYSPFPASVYVIQISLTIYTRDSARLAKISVAVQAADNSDQWVDLVALIVFVSDTESGVSLDSTSPSCPPYPCCMDYTAD